MILCRPSRFSDLDREDARGLVMRGLCAGAPEMQIDWPKVWGMCRELMAGPQHHAWLAFKDDVAVAYLGAMRTPTWEARDRFLVVGWFSEERGAGMLLLRKLLARARDDQGIGSVLVTAHADPQQRIARALSRYGATVAPTFNITV